MDGNVEVESVVEEDDGDVKVINVVGNNSMDENDVEEVDERALLISKEQKKQKRLGRPPNMQNEDGSSEITGDNMEYVKATEENNDHTTAKDTVTNTNTLKLKNSIGEADRRRMEQRLVRDQIVSMIMKAGWTIEYRPRQNGQYLDTVYIDMQGKTHWSVPKAYFTLKMKIEKGVAFNEEVSAFTLIPKEELSVLLRPVSKVRSNKNIKKNIGKNACKAEIIVTGVAQPKRHKKKLDKESKEKKATLTPKVTQKVVGSSERELILVPQILINLPHSTTFKTHCTSQ